MPQRNRRSAAVPLGLCLIVAGCVGAQPSSGVMMSGEPIASSGGRSVPIRGVSVSLSKVRSGDARPAVLSHPCSPPGGRFDRASRQTLVGWAEGLTYVPRDSTRAFVYGFAPSDSVSIEAAVVDAAGPQWDSPWGCITARLTSARAFPALGIGVGRNYLWADTLGGAYRTVVIPADSTVAIVVHPLVVHSHVAGATPPPRVGTVGVCGQCQRYWCRSGFGSIGIARLMEPRELERLRTNAGVR